MLVPTQFLVPHTGQSWGEGEKVSKTPSTVLLSKNQSCPLYFNLSSVGCVTLEEPPPCTQ